MIAFNPYTVSLNIAPWNLRVVQQHTASERPLNTVTFLRGEIILFEHPEDARKQCVIASDLCFHDAEPWFHLHRSQKVYLLEVKRPALVVATAKDPIQSAPLRQMIHADIASTRYSVTGCTLEFVVATLLVHGIWPSAIVIRLLELKHLSERVFPI